MVIQSKRSVSELEYVYNARNLQIATLQLTIKFPQRYTFYMGQRISQLSMAIYESVTMSESIQPKNDHEMQIKRDYLLKAYSLTQSLIAQIEVCHELFDLNISSIEKWSSLALKEEQLLRQKL